MKPEDQRISIAEACGHKALAWHGDVFIRGQNRGPAINNVPDYLGDLNACAEFESTLRPDDSYAYGERLAAMVRAPENMAFGDKIDKVFPFNGWGFSALACMTAPERCEAFLRVKGLWVDTP